MRTAPWICRKCLLRSARPFAQHQLRYQTTGEFHHPARLSSQADPNTKQATIETVPPALLTRARDVALEHKKLTEKLANGFEARVAKKLGQYGPVVSALGRWDKAQEVGARRYRQAR
jgi:peptide chain release factor 1